MPEPTLRHLFGESPAPDIDVSRVIRRSRARRAPRVLGAGAFAVLAVGAIAYGGFAGLAGLTGGTASDAGSAPMMEESGEDLSATSGSLHKGTQGLSVCAQPVATIPPSETGLILSVKFPSVGEVGAASVDGIVTMTNRGTETATWSTEFAPTITVSQGGIVVWHSHVADEVSTPIDLDPGESVDYPASFTPVVCDLDDEQPGAFRSDLPSAPPGQYEVSAAIDVYGNGTTAIIGGPSQTVTLR